MFRSFKFVILLVLVTLICECGTNSGKDTASCTPNVIDTGLQLYVSQLNSNIYQMQLCVAPTRTTVFSVYGAPSSAALADDGSLNTGLSKREPVHISDANGVGTAFQVTFNSTDNYFAIFQDRDTGDGNFTLDATKVLVHAHKLPGR